MVLAGCGGGSSHTNTQNNGTRTLVSITVTGANSATSLAAGTTLQLAAQGTYSDGTSSSLTSQVTWTTSDSTMAAASTSGLLTSFKAGSVTVTATQGSVSGKMNLSVTQATLSSISVLGAGSLSAGSTLQLSAQGTYTDKSTQSITSQATWLSSDATVASVNASGLVTALKAGSVTISASMNSVSGNAGVTVTAATVVLTAINVGTPSPSLAAGNTEQLTATGVYSDNSTQALTSQVTWSSSDTTVASVSAAGVLTAVKAGSVTLTATLGAVSGAGSVSVTAPALSSIAISPAAFSIASGQNKQLSATGFYANGTSQDVTNQVTWNSQNTGSATVSSSGLVSGVSAGSATITASIGSTTGTAVATITTAQLQSITITPLTASIASGQTQQFMANGIFSDGSQTDITNAVTWNSSDTTIANINAAGLASGVSAGTAAISASSGSVTSATPATLTVTSAILTEIDIAPDGEYIPVGGQYQLTLTGTYSNNSTQTITNATWSSSDSTFAAVDPNTGIVTGVANSNNIPITITASFGGQTNTTTVYITSAVPESLQLTPATASIASGTTQQYTANVVYSDGSIQPVTAGVAWTSSVATVAGIDSNGLATSLAPGQTTISAAYGAMTATASLTVTPAVLTNIVVTPITTVVGINGNVQFTATGVYSDNSTQDLTSQAVWTSSNATYAVISAGGVANGLSAGTTTITASFGSVSGSATLNVTTAVLQSITISPDKPIVPPHSRIQLTAIGHFSDGSQMPLSGVSWSTSAARYAIINGNGVLRTKRSSAAKTVTVTAALNGIKGQTTVTITSMSLKAMTVTPSTPTIAAGTTQAFSLIGTFSDGVTQVDLTASARWQTSNYQYAVINRQGVATGVAAGTVVITGTMTGVSGLITTATATLTVSNATVQSITVTPATPTIGLGSTQQFAASGLFSDGSTEDITSVVKWTSSSPTVAVIDANGLASSASHGQTDITATFQNVPGSTTLNVN
jgi:uncharacterized protein YjdB